jgi:hypothetical protein
VGAWPKAWDKTNKRRVIYGLVVSALQQLTGVNVMMFFSSRLVFSLTHVGKLEEIVSLTNGISTLFFVGVTLLFVDSK